LDPNESIYGPNAVIGSKEDADILEGRDVQILSTDTETINLQETQEGAEGAASANPEGSAEANQGSSEEDQATQLGKDVQNQLKANEDVKNDLTAKGVDFTALEKEYETAGDLSAESREALAKAGYPKSVVDAYISGLQATAERFSNHVLNVAGGKEAYEQTIKFIKSQGAQMVNTFNSVIDAGDLGQIELVIKGVQSQMATKYGTNNPTLLGGGNLGQESQGYTTKEEMVKAMSDKRYGRDPQYTKDVRLKTAKATFM